MTHDAAATVDFYTNVIGWKLVHALFNDHVPSTADAFPYVHLFFQLPDGSTVAFFESVDLPRPPAEPPHPAYPIFNHFAWKVASPSEVESWKAFLESKSIDYIGPVDHGICSSIYFFDPNGIRLEVVKHTEAKHGFVLMPRRWVVERSFAWAARFRRLARDYERLPETLAGLHFIAFACLLLSRMPLLLLGSLPVHNTL